MKAKEKGINRVGSIPADGFLCNIGAEKFDAVLQCITTRD